MTIRPSMHRRPGVIQILALAFTAVLAVTTFLVTSKISRESQNLRSSAYGPTTAPASPAPSPTNTNTCIAAGNSCYRYSCPSGYTATVGSCGSLSSMRCCRPLTTPTPRPTFTPTVSPLTPTPVYTCQTNGFSCHLASCPVSYTGAVGTCPQSGSTPNLCCRPLPTPTPANNCVIAGNSCFPNSCPSGYTAATQSCGSLVSMRCCRPLPTPTPRPIQCGYSGSYCYPYNCPNGTTTTRDICSPTSFNCCKPLPTATPTPATTCQNGGCISTTSVCSAGGNGTTVENNWCRTTMNGDYKCCHDTQYTCLSDGGNNPLGGTKINGLIYFDQKDTCWYHYQIPCNDEDGVDNLGPNACGPSTFAAFMATYRNPNYNPLIASKADFPNFSCAGVSLDQVRAALAKYNFKYEDINWNTQDINNYLNQGVKIWLNIHLVTKEAAPRTVFGHHTTIVGIKNGEYIVNDPYFGADLTMTEYQEKLTEKFGEDLNPLYELLAVSP